MKWNEIKIKWNNFFFQEAPVEGLAIFRVLLGILTLITFFQDSLIMDDLWGPYAIQSIKAASQNYSFPVLNLFQYLHLTSTLLIFLVALQYLSLICFTIGLKTKLSTILSFVLLVSFHQRNINVLSSTDLLMRILFMLMIFAPSGNAYSVDAWIAKGMNKPLKRNVPVWIHRLIQIQIAVVYVSTVIAKSKGATWLDGSAVYYATRLADMTRFPVPFLLDWKWFLMLSTWMTLVLEFALGTIIFIDEIRRPLILIGIIFHLGIEYTMSVPIFEWLMIVCLLAMFKFEDYRKFDTWLKARLPISIP